MSDSEIRTGIDHLLEELRHNVAVKEAEAARFEALTDLYLEQLSAMAADRDRLQARVNEFKAIACGHPGCCLLQIADPEEASR